jgi:hypothetical protein
MPASDILNPSPYWQETLQDSMCPNYGFTRKRASTLLNKKPTGSTPWTRETENTGHTFPFSWLQRSTACMKTLKRYYEQYEDGFFTIIDWDDPQPGGPGRHYVGRFTGDFPATETGNGMWDIQNLAFEEMPEVAMIKYPADWDNDAVRFYAYNDFGDQKLATYTSQTVGWAANQRNVLGKAVTTMDNPAAAGNAGDWATYEYRGYGFKLYLMSGPEFGQCTVYLDSVQVGAYAGAAAATIDCYTAEDIGPKAVVVQPNVPLDFHRVQVNVSSTKNADATAPTISWHSLEVMR